MRLIKSYICIFFIISLFSYSLEFNCKVIYNSQDVQKKLQEVIDNPKYDKIIIPFMGEDKVWNSGPIALKSNKEIIFEKGVIFKAVKGIEFQDIHQSFFSIYNCENINIIGNGAEIKMNKDEYFDGEWRHGISIRKSKNITIDNINILETGGDGILISKYKDKSDYSENIKIKNCIFNKNARQGITIGSAENVVIEYCKFLETGKGNNPKLAEHGPGAGIDFEPDDWKERISNITIKNCFFENNTGYGILIQLNHMNKDTKKIDINLEGLVISGGTVGISIVNKNNNSVDTNINMKNIDIKGFRKCGLRMNNNNINLKMKFENVEISKKNLLSKPFDIIGEINPNFDIVKIKNTFLGE